MRFILLFVVVCNTNFYSFYFIDIYLIDFIGWINPYFFSIEINLKLLISLKKKKKANQIAKKSDFILNKTSNIHTISEIGKKTI